LLEFESNADGRSTFVTGRVWAAASGRRGAGHPAARRARRDSGSGAVEKGKTDGLAAMPAGPGGGLAAEAAAHGRPLAGDGWWRNLASPGRRGATSNSRVKLSRGGRASDSRVLPFARWCIAGHAGRASCSFAVAQGTEKPDDARPTGGSFGPGGVRGQRPPPGHHRPQNGDVLAKPDVRRAPLFAEARKIIDVDEGGVEPAEARVAWPEPSITGPEVRTRLASEKPWLVFWPFQARDHGGSSKRKSTARIPGIGFSPRTSAVSTPKRGAEAPLIGHVNIDKNSGASPAWENG